MKAAYQGRPWAARRNAASVHNDASGRRGVVGELFHERRVRRCRTSCKQTKGLEHLGRRCAHGGVESAALSLSLEQGLQCLVCSQPARPRHPPRESYQVVRRNSGAGHDRLVCDEAHAARHGDSERGLDAS